MKGHSLQQAGSQAPLLSSLPEGVPGATVQAEVDLRARGPPSPDLSRSLLATPPTVSWKPGGVSWQGGARRLGQRKEAAVRKAGAPLLPLLQAQAVPQALLSQTGLESGSTVRLMVTTFLSLSV